jgi:hypothetical protein
LSDKEAVKKELQLAAAAQPAMQRAKELEKAYEAELNRLMSNPWEVLQELGLDPEQLSTQFLEKKVEEMKKSPAEIEKEKLEAEVKKYREDMKRMQEESERARLEQLQEQEAVTLEKEIMDALDNQKKQAKKDLGYSVPDYIENPDDYLYRRMLKNREYEQRKNKFIEDAPVMGK